jgi:hypothetical protein
LIEEQGLTSAYDLTLFDEKSRFEIEIVSPNQAQLCDGKLLNLLAGFARNRQIKTLFDSDHKGSPILSKRI